MAQSQAVEPQRRCPPGRTAGRMRVRKLNAKGNEIMMTKIAERAEQLGTGWSSEEDEIWDRVAVPIVSRCIAVAGEGSTFPQRRVGKVGPAHRAILIFADTKTACGANSFLGCASVERATAKVARR